MLHINFSKSELFLTQHLCFLGLFWDTVDMSLSLPSDKFLKIQQLAHSLLQKQPATVHQAMSFLRQGQFLCQQTCTTSSILFCNQSKSLNVYHFPTHLFCSFHLSFPVLHQTLEFVSDATELSHLVIPLSYCGYHYRYYPSSLGILFTGFWDYTHNSVEPGQTIYLGFP